jgi:hypothetical protein
MEFTDRFFSAGYPAVSDVMIYNIEAMYILLNLKNMG